MKKHILIVDDEADIRNMLAQFLAASGYRVTAVATAMEALRIGREESPDLIISDLQLEDRDGLEMIAELKAARPDQPVILLTGVLFDSEVAGSVLRAKVSRYLEKTSSLARILTVVRELLNPASSAGPSPAVDP
jgi:DNA-binding response OmpR family regulator